MKGNFKLVTQYPKPKEICFGILSIQSDGFASFFSGDGGNDSKIVADMVRCKIDFAAAHGIMLSGMEPKGFDKAGRQKYQFQEWWLIYAEVARGEAKGEKK